MNDSQALGQLLARSIGWSIGLGAATGVAVGAIAALSYGSALEVVTHLAVAIPIGGGVGMLLGFVVGVPTILITVGVARQDLYRRIIGAVVAAVIAAGVVGCIIGGDGLALGFFEMFCGAMAAANAWFALGRILRPPPVRPGADWYR